MTDQAVQSAVRKAARRLVPFLIVAYAVNFLDRVNLGFAALGMNEDLGLTSAMFGFGAGIFFIGYILFEIPSNLALHRFGARLWITRIMISWGLVSTAMAFVAGETSFYVFRFLLGVAEAGFFPGIILYLTYWFPRTYRAGIVSAFMTAVPVASVVGAPISGALLGLHGMLGIAGWRWLFFLEGLPAILLGVAALFYLTDRPSEARWLTGHEAEALASRLAGEEADARSRGPDGLAPALTNPRVVLLGLLYFCIVIGLYGLSFWMPQVLQGFALGHLEIGVFTAIPYLFATIGMVLAGRSSDRRRERILHVALPLALAAGAFVWSAYAGSLPLTLVALSLAALGLFAAIGTFWSLPAPILSGVGAAGGLALINSIGNSGGFVGPLVIAHLKGTSGYFTSSLLFLAGSLALAAVLTLLFRQLEKPA